MKEKKKVKLLRTPSNVKAFEYCYTLYIWYDDIKAWVFDGDSSGVDMEGLMSCDVVDTLVEYLQHGYEVVTDA